MNKLDIWLKVLTIVLCLAVSIIFFTAMYLVFEDGIKESEEYVICNKVQKLYKDDIMFDNFYISCDDETIEIGKELYVRIIENQDYKITYNKLGGIYLIEKVEDE